MKKIIPFMLLAVMLNACGSSKNYLERSNENKALQDAVKKLNKSSADEQATQAIPILYASILKTTLARISSYQTGSDLGRWDKIIDDYSSLQDAYNNIINSTAAFRLVTPENFSTQLLETKEAAAGEYYNAGDDFLSKTGRDNAKKAYSYFKKSAAYVKGYKDAESKIAAAYENAIVDVVINPVQDDRFFYNSGWGNSGYDYSNEYFQRSLVRDLSYNNNSNNQNYPARFYSDWEAGRENVQADWIVDLRLRNMNLPQPYNSSYRRERSTQVQDGKDTSGKPIYKTVRATVNISRMSFTAHADMDMIIKDVVVPQTVSSRSFREDYRWQTERASYTGDSRALTNEDWQIINNNSNYFAPKREDVLNELYKKIYPQVLNAIKYSVSW
jgi:hypothetical protein